MAKLVCKVEHNRKVVRLDAEEGEELSIELVSAWAGIEQSIALNEIAYRLMGIENALNTVADAIDRSD